ncbi:MAG: 16S rRNA (guanine(966)-N(2))-methyltransferase RsmD [Flavobacteriales bacterium]
MRIISGKYRGKRLTAPKNLPVRPTTDMAKESLFNILNNRYYFQNIRVLDLFSGTGNISYEFASRGTMDIICIDQNFHCIKFIKKIISELSLEKEITPVKSDVFKFLRNHQSSYNLIFADPPYDFSKEQYHSIPDLIFQNRLLYEDGLLVIEHSPYTELSQHPHFMEQRKYGSVCFSFFNNL